MIETQRLDANRVRILTDADLDILLFATASVPIDRASLHEVATIAGIADTVDALNGVDFFGDPAKLHRAVLTPDFHKGAGIPVGTVLDAEGFVLPRCVGTDIGCGIRLMTTDLTRDDFARLNNFDAILRHTFFEGGRNIPLDERDRTGMLRDGTMGLHSTAGLCRYIDLADELAHTHRVGWPTTDLWMFEDYVRGSGGISRDAAIGTVSGGNHFVEIQFVEQCIDRKTCWEWGLRPGMITIMAHNGSLGFGGMVADHFVDLAKKLYPTKLSKPTHGYQPLPTRGPLAGHGAAYLSAMGLAANFATVNRLMLGLMVIDSLQHASQRDIAHHLLYDAPHNLVWCDAHNLHRKGATPAGCEMDDPIFPHGHPVIVPGSMGDASYVLRGHGSVGSLCSAPHGAGRLTARGTARKGSVADLQALRVVTPIDLTTARRDVRERYLRDLLEEAPNQYKPITPVIETIRDGGIATPVAKLQPLLTIKR